MSGSPKRGERKKKNAAFNLASELPLRILIAEDNVINQKLLISILEMLGYTSTAVFDGNEVLDQVKKETFDLILMDIQMPEMSGEATATQLHELLKETRPKIIAVTAYAMDGDREKYLRAGMDGYISKPFRIEELVTEIRRVMKGEKG